MTYAPDPEQKMSQTSESTIKSRGEGVENSAYLSATIGSMSFVVIRSWQVPHSI